MKTFMRQTWRRKGAAAAILIFFMIGNGMISAKAEKPGAILVVQKPDGQAVRGELLEVKDGILKLLVYENASKMDIRLDELSGLRIEKKSAILKGIGIGILAGSTTGALLGFLSGGYEAPRDRWGIFSFTSGELAIGYGVSLGAIGGAIGGVVGAMKGTDKSISLIGLSPEKLRRIEAKLSSLARFKPDLIAEFRERSLKKSE